MDIFEGCGKHYFANLCKIYIPLYLVITQRNTTHTLKPGVGRVLEKERERERENGRLTKNSIINCIILLISIIRC